MAGELPVAREVACASVDQAQDPSSCLMKRTSLRRKSSTCFSLECPLKAQEVEAAVPMSTPSSVRKYALIALPALSQSFADGFTRPQTRPRQHRQAHAHHGEQRQEGFFSGILQLLPILLMLLLLMFSAFFREEALFKLVRALTSCRCDCATYPPHQGTHGTLHGNAGDRARIQILRPTGLQCRPHRQGIALRRLLVCNARYALTDTCLTPPQVEQEVNGRWEQYLRDTCYAQMQEKRNLVNK